MIARNIILCFLLLSWTEFNSCSSSDGKVWPPEGITLSDDVRLWPGHLKPLATDFPKKEVKFHEGCPALKQFLSDYVTKSIPVVLKNIDVNMKSFSLERFKIMPEAFTMFVGVKKEGEEKIKQISARQFLSTYKTEKLNLDIAIPTLLKSQIQLPSCLRCKAVLDELLQTRMIFYHEKVFDKLRSNPDHSLFCPVNGKTEILFINPETFAKHSEVMDLNGGKASGVDVKKVDYEKYPSLREVEYFTASVESGSCVFIPASWLHQLIVEDSTLCLSISWEKKMFKPTASTCGNVSDTYLISMNFKRDPPPDILSLFIFHNFHQFIEEYFLKGPNSKMDYKEFVKQIRKSDYTADIIEWDDECEAIAEEMFSQIDKNSDGFLSVEDFDDINLEETLEMSGRIDDRIADFKDIAGDQQSEKKKSVFQVAKDLTNEQDNVRKILEDGFGEIFRDIEALTKESDAEKSAETSETKSANGGKTANQPIKGTESDEGKSSSTEQGTSENEIKKDEL